MCVCVRACVICFKFTTVFFLVMIPVSWKQFFTHIYVSRKSGFSHVLSPVFLNLTSPPSLHVAHPPPLLSPSLPSPLYPHSHLTGKTNNGKPLLLKVVLQGDNGVGKVYDLDCYCDCVLVVFFFYNSVKTPKRNHNTHFNFQTSLIQQYKYRRFSHTQVTIGTDYVVQGCSQQL